MTLPGSLTSMTVEFVIFSRKGLKGTSASFRSRSWFVMGLIIARVRSLRQLHVDRGDLHGRVVLAVADLLVVALAAAVLEGDDLGAFGWADNIGSNRRAGDERGADAR